MSGPRPYGPPNCTDAMGNLTDTLFEALNAANMTILKTMEMDQEMSMMNATETTTMDPDFIGNSTEFLLGKRNDAGRRDQVF